LPGGHLRGTGGSKPPCGLCSAVVYARLGQKIPPLALNLSKGSNCDRPDCLDSDCPTQLLTEIDAVALGLLLLSGVLGIGLGDTFYFEALNSLGARRTLLLVAPPRITPIALTLQEALSLRAWWEF